MPAYDYQCTECKEEIEISYPLDNPLTAVYTCEKCGGVLRKKFSPPGIVFKGTGWASKDK